MGELLSRTVKGTNRPDAKPVGRPAVGVREPPRPNGTPEAPAGLSQRTRVGPPS
jgi:hypothetical protein